MITVFADKYLYEIASLLPADVDLHFYDPEQGFPKNKSDIDALLIRTVTKINEDTWHQIPENLQFVGTGSAGTDHVDISFLERHDISFADAGGCNARSVAEYVATGLLLWADALDFKLSEKSAGIVGVGHVGTEVAEILHNLNVRTILHDPPRAERESSFSSATQDEVLKADILTFHTPLTRTRSYPTHHWLDEEKLSNHSFELIINTARGGVVNEKALLKAAEEETVQNFVLDVWENEPCFDDTTAQQAWIKTPHIAGYSKQAKLRASQLIAEALCRHFSLPLKPPEHPAFNPGRIEFPDIQTKDVSLTKILKHIHPIGAYEKELEILIDLPDEQKGIQFNRLRAGFPLRDEFQFLSLPEEILKKFPVLASLGFAD